MLAIKFTVDRQSERDSLMNALIGLLLLAGVLYGALVDGTFWKIYGVLVTVYLVFVMLARDIRENPKRKTILAATWSRK